MASVAAGTGGVGAGAEPGVSTAATRLSLEHRMLLTATLCLLAGGAVMVYSASSPSTLSGGSGTGILIRFAGYALVGLIAMRFAARIGLDTMRRLTGPLLGVAFALKG